MSTVRPPSRVDRRVHLRVPGLLPVFLAVFMAVMEPAFTSAGNDPPQPRASMRTALVAFIETLSEAERAITLAPINAPDRGRWTYLAGPRTGLRLGDLGPDSRAAFDRFLQAALSPIGLTRVRQVLRVEPIEDRGGGVRTGPGEYWIRIHGDPTSDGSAWAWRLEGHHLVLNTAVVDGEIVSVTPFFIGASPARHVEFGEPLAAEDRAVEDLVETLDREQSAAVTGIGRPPGDIRSGTAARPRPLADGGVRGDRLTAAQRAALDAIVLGLLDFWPSDATGRLRDRWRTQDPAKLAFGWAGSETRSGPHYWRIDSPILLVEFSNTSSSFDHAHLVLRTQGDEFPGR